MDHKSSCGQSSTNNAETVSGRCSNGKTGAIRDNIQTTPSEHTWGKLLHPFPRPCRSETSRSVLAQETATSRSLLYSRKTTRREAPRGRREASGSPFWMARIEGTTRPPGRLSSRLGLCWHLAAEDFWANEGFRDASSDSEFNAQEETRAKLAGQREGVQWSLCRSPMIRKKPISAKHKMMPAQRKRPVIALSAVQAAVTLDMPGPPNRAFGRTLLSVARRVGNVMVVRCGPGRSQCFPRAGGRFNLGPRSSEKKDEPKCKEKSGQQWPISHHTNIAFLSSCNSEPRHSPEPCDRSTVDRLLHHATPDKHELYEKQKLSCTKDFTSA